MARGIARSLLVLVGALAATVATSALPEPDHVATLDLSGRRFRTLPRTLPASSTAPATLDASHNLLTTLDDKAFAGLSSLRTLNLSDNILEKWGQRPFRDLGALTVLDVSRNRFSMIDASVLADLTSLRVLNLTDNTIKVLGKGAFPELDNLQELDLSHNDLESLEDDTFVTLSSLIRLDLRGNLLSTLGEKDLRGLSRVQTLLLGGNLISGSAPGALQGLNSLSELSLADNPGAGALVLVGRRLQCVDLSRAGLEAVPAALTRSVRELLLSGNNLRAVSCGDLDSYPLLQALDISNNTLAVVEDDALGRLEQLVTLILTRNKLQLVPPSLPVSLVTLELDFNQIRSIGSNDLQGLRLLKLLVLRSNNISTIQDGAFRHLDSLEVLDLSDNSLLQLHTSALLGPTALRQLYLSNLRSIKPPAEWLPFPLQSPERLTVLDLDQSPALAKHLLADTAALTAMRQLQVLRMSGTGLRHLRSDLPQLLVHLKTLRISGNPWNCAGLRWLIHWLRTLDEDAGAKSQCVSPTALAGRVLRDLQDEDFNETVSGTEEGEELPPPPLALPLGDRSLMGTTTVPTVRYSTADFADKKDVTITKAPKPVVFDGTSSPDSTTSVVVQTNEPASSSTALPSSTMSPVTASSSTLHPVTTPQLKTTPPATSPQSKILPSSSASPAETSTNGFTTKTSSAISTVPSTQPPPVAAALAAVTSTVVPTTSAPATIAIARTSVPTSKVISTITTTERTTVTPRPTILPAAGINVTTAAVTASSIAAADLATRVAFQRSTLFVAQSTSPSTSTETPPPTSSKPPAQVTVALLTDSQSTLHRTRSTEAPSSPSTNDTGTYLRHMSLENEDMSDSTVEGPAAPRTAAVVAMFSVAGLAAGGVLLAMVITRNTRQRQQLMRLHSMEDLVLRGSDPGIPTMGIPPPRSIGVPVSELW